jgi:hypothetical protein
VEVKLADAIAGSYQRYSITVKGRELVVKRGDKESQHVTLPAGAKASGPLGLNDNGVGMELMNLYARDL